MTSVTGRRKTGRRTSRSKRGVIAGERGEAALVIAGERGEAALVIAGERGEAALVMPAGRHRGAYSLGHVVA